MGPRQSISAALQVATVLFVLAGCNSRDTGPPDGVGWPVSGASAAAAGTGGQSSTAGEGGVGAGGQSSAAGAGGGSAGEPSAAGSGGAGATAGDSGGGNTVDATFDTLKFVVEQAPCFGAGCHNDDQNRLDLRLDAELYTRITTLVSANCGDIPIVTPGNPEASALVKILKGPCGPTPRMPLGCIEDDDAMCIPAEYVAAIEQWIASGAPPQ
jgi:hypothetical protein